jgi:DNA polymerase
MRWSDRQLAMLREMGIRVWSRNATGTEAMADDGDTIVATQAPERAPAPVVRSPAVAYATGPIAATSEPTPAPTLSSAEWLIVGEPFDAIGGAGDSGGAGDQERLLDNMLHAIRVARKAPGRDGRACHLPIGEGQRVDLDDAIARVGPRCILALGRAAANALLALDEPLGRLRERVHERRGVPVVVSFALPYLLRHPADKAKAWADLCRAVSALDAPGTTH